MANSNENTQNPKDNQNKMTDEGIQEHSEHTAENKQPESEENAAKNDDAAKQEEMKQADTVEQPKEQRKLSDHLETISKLIGISTVLGIFFGGFVIYVYLLKINQLSFLPDVISNPSNLIAASTIFILFFINIIFLEYVLIYLLLKEFPLLRQDIRNWRSLKSNYSDIDTCLLRLSFTFLYLIIFFGFSGTFAIILRYLIPQESNAILFLSLLITLRITIYIIYKKLIKSLNSNYKKSIINGIMTNAIVILGIIILLGDKIEILYFTHFIQKYKDSSWYLLHNNFQQNNGSQETNGIDKNDLIKLKQNFKCSILSEEEKVKKDIECSLIPEQRNNALYGYMAWNLGDTKFFCPATTDNTKADFTKAKGTKEREAADKLAEECIAISGKALQIMPKGYISTNTDGIDDGNPENTGHDNPAIDINTDVRFKNDLNAQSNAGLNNFNIQPVLPIQSDAKNMSIQIHYGSCNHDSPRNKDGHPDIGYTDKKICQ